jgi:hypothetical protein
MKRPEPVQKGNPHKLTVNQHTFPSRSIERFAQGGGVEVREKGPGRTLRRPPDDVLFCARRVWDHRSEHGFMLKIENAFQRVADKILQGQQSLTKVEHFSITDFYLLWNLRQRARSDSPTFPPLLGWKPERLTTEKDKQERFEKSGVVYWDQNGEIPNRILTGTSLQMQVWIERERMEGTNWGIFRIKPGHGEFLVSDRLSQHSAVPLSPELCLVADHASRFVDFSFVGRYNGLAVENAEDYYFARNIKDCPILLRATLRDSLTRAGLLDRELRYAGM